MLEQSTLDGCLLSCFLFLVLYICSIRRKEQLLSSNVSVWIHVLILLFCAFAFWNTDYYHYQETLGQIDTHYSYSDQYTHIEELYLWIYDICGMHYTLFRIIVWGVAYLFFVLAAKKIGIYNNLTFSLFIILFLLTFSYARVSLGMATFFYACTLLSDKQNRLLKIIIGMLCCILAFFSHKSMVALLCLLPFSFIKYNRWIWLLVMAMVLIVVHNYSDYITTLLFGTVDTMDEASDLYDTFASASTYNDANLDRKVGIGELLQNILQYASIFVPLVMLLGKNGYSCLQNTMQYRILYNVAILIAIVGLSMGVLVSFNSPLCYRYLYMAYIPIVLSISLLFQKKLISTTQLGIIIILGSASVWYRLLYVVYNASVNL